MSTQRFTDCAGRSWLMEITVSTIKRVRALLDFDLYACLSDPKGIEELIRNPILLVDVVYAVIKPQADAAGVSDEDFGAAMAGDPIDAATQALLDALVNFCPSPRDRANLGRIVQKTREVMDQARSLIEHRIQSGALDQAILEQIPEADRPFFTTSSGNAPASSGSTPAPSPSAS